MWDLQQRDDIRDLEEQLREARVRQAGDAGDLARLEGKVATLARELAALKVAFDVLAHAVVEAGGLDLAELDRRMNEALAKAEASRKEAEPVKCANCGMTYRAPDTTITPLGRVCKRCHGL